MLTDHQILQHVREAVASEARSQGAYVVAHKQATAAETVTRAKDSLRESGCRITARVESLIIDELQRIEIHAKQFPSAVFFYLAVAAERRGRRSAYYFTKHDRIECDFRHSYTPGEQHLWFHNGVQIDLDRAVELVPMPDPETMISID